MSEDTTPSDDHRQDLVQNCTTPSWDPTCSGRQLPPARPSFPNLLKSFPRLERYLRKHKQEKNGFSDALGQILGGNKTGCWIWWILPQVAGEVSHHAPERGDGSNTSREFALESLYEAIAFLSHPELGQNFFRILRAIRYQIEPGGRRGGQRRTLNEIFHGDAQKVRCSVALFRRLADWCYPLSDESYATLIADCDAILAAASRDGHHACGHVEKLYREFEKSLEDPEERAKMQEMFPTQCIHCGGPVWPPGENWNLWHKWCVEENGLTWPRTPPQWPGIKWNRMSNDLRLSSLSSHRPTTEPFSQKLLAASESWETTETRSRVGISNLEDLASEAQLLKLQQFKDRMRPGNWDGPPVRYQSQKDRQEWLQGLAPEDDVPLEDLDLDPTLVGFLKGNDIRGVAKLVSHTEEELMAIRHLGSGKAAKIRAGLERFGWRLGEVSVRSFLKGRNELDSAKTNQLQEAKSLVWPLVSKGSSIDRIVESTGLSKAAVREARNHWMVDQRIAGLSNRAIGETVGMSAEAVRRSIARFLPTAGFDNDHIDKHRAERKAEQTKQLEERIRKIVTENPGLSLDEIAEKADVSRKDVRRNLTQLGTKLVRDVNKRNDSPMEQWSDEQLLQALRAASTRSTPLTVVAYDAMRTLPDIKGPTGQVFYLRFGSWKEACEAAGIQCGESARDKYTRRWSETDLEEFVVDFLFSPEHDGSHNEFEKWLNGRPDNPPSMATIHNRLGDWGSMKQKAIETIKASGRLDGLCDLFN